MNKEDEILIDIFNFMFLFIPMMPQNNGKSYFHYFINFKYYEFKIIQSLIFNVCQRTLHINCETVMVF